MNISADIGYKLNWQVIAAYELSLLIGPDELTKNVSKPEVAACNIEQHKLPVMVSDLRFGQIGRKKSPPKKLPPPALVELHRLPINCKMMKKGISHDKNKEQSMLQYY